MLAGWAGAFGQGVTLQGTAGSSWSLLASSNGQQGGRVLSLTASKKRPLPATCVSLSVAVPPAENQALTDAI